MSLPGKMLSGSQFRPCDAWIRVGPNYYPEQGLVEDRGPNVCLRGKRNWEISIQSAFRDGSQGVE